LTINPNKTVKNFNYGFDSQKNTNRSFTVVKDDRPQSVTGGVLPAISAKNMVTLDKNLTMLRHLQNPHDSGKKNVISSSGVRTWARGRSATSLSQPYMSSDLDQAIQKHN